MSALSPTCTFFSIFLLPLSLHMILFFFLSWYAFLLFPTIFLPQNFHSHLILSFAYLLYFQPGSTAAYLSSSAVLLHPARLAREGKSSTFLGLLAAFFYCHGQHKHLLFTTWFIYKLSLLTFCLHLFPSEGGWQGILIFKRVVFCFIYLFILLIAHLSACLLSHQRLHVVIIQYSATMMWIENSPSGQLCITPTFFFFSSWVDLPHRN